MENLINELSAIQQRLTSLSDEIESDHYVMTLKLIEDKANEIGRAWSGSWAGYHANVYYKDFATPPPGRHFDKEWGFVYASPAHEWWIEYGRDEIESLIESAVAKSDLEYIEELASNRVSALFNQEYANVVSILTVAEATLNGETFLEGLLEKAKGLEIRTPIYFVSRWRPRQVVSRDSKATSQGIWTPPHYVVLAKTSAIRSSVDTLNNLADIIEQAITHLNRLTSVSLQKSSSVNKVFIGHGGSQIWKDLRDFLHQRLSLDWDEFNRVPTAGTTTVERLQEMLDTACFAFLVMTAEDEQPNGELRARMNVVHEVGLFQGRLGFNKAIILLEEGCQEFSNIHGLTQIRFPKNDIMSKSEDIRQVLEREGII